MPDLLDLKLGKMPILCKSEQKNKVDPWLYNDDFVAFLLTKQSDVVICHRRSDDEVDGKLKDIRLPRQLKESRKVVTSQDVAVAVDGGDWMEKDKKLSIFRLAGDASEMVQVKRPDGQPLELVEERALEPPKRDICGGMSVCYGKYIPTVIRGRVNDSEVLLLYAVAHEGQLAVWLVDLETGAVTCEYRLRNMALWFDPLVALGGWYLGICTSNECEEGSNERITVLHANNGKELLNDGAIATKGSFRLPYKTK